MAIESAGHAQRLLLQHDTVRALIDPGRGGVASEFSWRGLQIFRPAATPAGDNPLDEACFPMVPFCNRIAFGRFEFAGHEVLVPRNWEGDAHTIHGEGWRGRWFVVESSERHVHMAFAGGGTSWPWRYRAEQRVNVDPDGLNIELSAVNVGQETMPLMLGLHPYFIAGQRARLRARLPRYWHAGDTSLPMTETAAPLQSGFESSAGEHLPIIDNCFSGWDGVATLFRSDCTVGIRATGCRWLHLYRPPDQDYVCIEPQNSATGALNRGGAGVQVLRPGERSVISLRVAVEQC